MAIEAEALLAQGEAVARVNAILSDRFSRWRWSMGAGSQAQFAKDLTEAANTSLYAEATAKLAKAEEQIATMRAALEKIVSEEDPCPKCRALTNLDQNCGWNCPWQPFDAQRIAHEALAPEQPHDA